MGQEDKFALDLAGRLRTLVPGLYEIETKRSLLYAISFGDDGKLHLGQDDQLQPTRGGGTGFEQDLLVFERVEGGDTSIVPRVSVEIKFGQMTTHDAIVYSEKARLIRTVYPFIRYGLVLGRLAHIPPRTLRLGTEFDFIAAVAAPIEEQDLANIAALLMQEVRLSCRMTSILRGQTKVAFLHRHLSFSEGLPQPTAVPTDSRAVGPDDR